ncbi:glycoside hydrolase family 43 protein [Aplosporella prunicola CBS 121167]|uniref:Arabinan endo-1,5-alpha-L-arabinosidase n=1 Tax=Aplosporella prunicola CBS 121167 TaxID=1176127 RepID=A0A6A6AU49_9PEZI|nr:glycoside hydrolase family 43 protein [Aplosporella prunicola CBS 121167]KAF2135220.1 glycoside hydrolase family 43 protein [Aplosporella prunicola CBS 121167]
MLLAASTALAVSLPMECSGICGNAHDSSLIRRESDGTYFRFSTGGGIAVHSASDLTGPWEYQGDVLESSSIDGNTDLWAPDVSLVGDTYYLYYSDSSFGSQASTIGVATSTTLDVGSWKDLGSSGVSSKEGSNYNAIDGNLFADGDNYYLNFGSFWGDLYQVPMKNPPTAPSGSSYNIELNTTGTRPSEGAYEFKSGNYYYLFFSSGVCCSLDTSKPAQGEEYKIMVCRSDSATGEFVDANGNSCTSQNGGTEVLASHDNIYAPGGQGVYDDPTYGPVLYYHYVDTNVGYADGDKLFGINKLDFSSGWPVVA